MHHRDADDVESMIEAPVPTRAEVSDVRARDISPHPPSLPISPRISRQVSDVANAIFDGSDAVMLSGECAVGKFTCETVEAMGRTISAAEHHVRVMSPGF